MHVSKPLLDKIHTNHNVSGVLLIDPEKIIESANENRVINILDYRGHPVMLAASKLDIAGVEWFVVTQFDQSEVDANMNASIVELIRTGAYVGLVIFVVILILSMALARWITRPIAPLCAFAERLSTGDFINGQDQLHLTHDDLGALGKSMIKLQQDLQISQAETLAAQEKQVQILERDKQIAVQNSRLMHELEDILRGLAHGELNKTLSIDIEGEFSLMPQHLNDAVIKLRELISKILSAGELVKNGVKEIATGNQDLSQRTEEQAASISQTASTMDKFASSIKDTANQASEASSLALTASNNAEAGGEAIMKVSTAMSNIKESSNKIVSIIAVIDEIAFQTNLLALNAAVEAARAGEQGRGFAVVASEVRNLAQRSAQAAKEIKDLIHDSVEKVTYGTGLVNHAKETLDAIILAIKSASTTMGDIATSSREQSDRVLTVNNAVSELESITQQNAALVEEATAASTAIDEHATEMVSLLSTFTIDDQSSAVKKPVATIVKNVSTPIVAREMQDIKSPIRKTASEKKDDEDEWESF
jgi:methyl-accepting chemotaxis protein